MGYSSRSGRARTSPSSPQAFGVCDRCGIWTNFVNLHWQFDWRGAALQNLRILVCRSCTDQFQPQLRSIVVPADPTPIINARVENFLADESNYRAVSIGNLTDPVTGLPVQSDVLLLSQSGENMSTQATGFPLGYDANAQPPLYGTVHYGELLPVLSVFSNGSTIVTVTCSSVHGLVNNDQVAVEGLAENTADGFYSVTVTSATAFTFTTNGENIYGPLLLANSRITTITIGIPLGFTQIPQTGYSLQRNIVFPYLETESGLALTTESGAPLEIEA